MSMIYGELYMRKYPASEDRRASARRVMRKETGNQHCGSSNCHSPFRELVTGGCEGCVPDECVLHWGIRGFSILGLVQFYLVF